MGRRLFEGVDQSKERMFKASRENWSGSEGGETTQGLLADQQVVRSRIWQPQKRNTSGFLGKPTKVFPFPHPPRGVRVSSGGSRSVTALIRREEERVNARRGDRGVAGMLAFGNFEIECLRSSLAAWWNCCDLSSLGCTVAILSG
jgi:hypothetical protein